MKQHIDLPQQSCKGRHPNLSGTPPNVSLDNSNLGWTMSFRYMWPADCCIYQGRFLSSSSPIKLSKKKISKNEIENTFTLLIWKPLRYGKTLHLIILLKESTHFHLPLRRGNLQLSQASIRICFTRPLIPILLLLYIIYI